VNVHLADVQTALMNVRFEGNYEHDADVRRMTTPETVYTSKVGKLKQ
jgi:hypothetical protein